PVICTAQDQCHVGGTCNPATGACSTPNAPDGTACNDGNACTDSDVCTGGQCVGTPVDLTLTVIKHVVNDDGNGLAAKDFTFELAVNRGIPMPVQGSETGTTFTLHDKDTYTVTEDLTHQPAGNLNEFYQSSRSVDCDSALACTPESERHKTCT